MNRHPLVTALVESAITYGAYVLMTTSESDLLLLRSKVYRYIARASQATASAIGRVGIHAERKASECLS